MTAKRRKRLSWSDLWRTHDKWVASYRADVGYGAPWPLYLGRSQKMKIRALVEVMRREARHA